MRNASKYSKVSTQLFLLLDYSLDRHIKIHVISGFVTIFQLVHRCQQCKKL